MDLKSYNKQYYENHKDKLLQYHATKIECICGKIISRGAYNYHRKSNLHKNRIQHKIENEEIKKKLNITSMER